MSMIQEKEAHSEYDLYKANTCPHQADCRGYLELLDLIAFSGSGKYTFVTWPGGWDKAWLVVVVLWERPSKAAFTVATVGFMAVT